MRRSSSTAYRANHPVASSLIEYEVFASGVANKDKSRKKATGTRKTAIAVRDERLGKEKTYAPIEYERHTGFTFCVCYAGYSLSRNHPILLR